MYMFFFPIDLQANQKTVSKLKLSHGTHLALTFLHLMFTFNTVLFQTAILLLPFQRRKSTASPGLQGKERTEWFKDTLLLQQV